MANKTKHKQEAASHDCRVRMKPKAAATEPRTPTGRVRKISFLASWILGSLDDP
jgi:hypothetical protein